MIVDQLVSPTPGFVPTHRGTPSTKWYIGATIFVDHFSNFTYAHLMTEMNAETTVEAKLAFEQVCNTHGVWVVHYHADNNLFDTKAFKVSVIKIQQTLSFCTVNVHHQNGKVKQRIKVCTECARTYLLHAAHISPNSVSPLLWPFPLKNYVKLTNSLPTQFIPGWKEGRHKLPNWYDSSPISQLSGTEVEANLNQFHKFGSPVYILENLLQNQKSHNKWSYRACVGIFMCHSPHHSTSVLLVLNMKSRNFSP